MILAVNPLQAIVKFITGIWKGLSSAWSLINVAPRILNPLSFIADFPIVGTALTISCGMILAFIVVDLVRDLL